MAEGLDRDALEALGREELVVEARRFGVKRPEVMTRVELVDEVLRLGTPNPVERKKVRGWLGVARDLIASAVELGLNLPDAAAMIRGEIRFEPRGPEHPPVATVTLAEIYGAQGHFDRAIGMLDEVVESESDHEVARRLRARLVGERDAKRAKQGSNLPSEDGLEPVTPEARTLSEDESEQATLVPNVPAWSEAADDDPDPVTLPPAAQAAGEPADDEPEHATLMPARPAASALAEDEPDHATLMPARPAASELTEDEPDHVTLMPASPSTGELADDEPDRATLMPAKPSTSELVDDGPDLMTLIPAPRTVDANDEPDALTLFPAAPPASSSAGLEPAPEANTAEAAATAESPTAGSADLPDEPREDAVVLLRTGAASASVYFEVGDAATNGHVPVLRVVEYRARAGGVERVERDHSLNGRRGTLSLLDLECGSVVRAALGRKWDGHFRATSVAGEVRPVPGSHDVLWAPRKGTSFDGVVARSAVAGSVPLQG